MIWNNNTLINLSGLDNLDYIGGNISFLSNYSLENLNGLENLDSIGGYLWIENNGLTNLSGLNNLRSIIDFLSISDNPYLTDISALINMASVRIIGIYHNDNLTTLFGLDSIDAGSIDTLAIFDNSSLATCEVRSVCDYLSEPGGTIEIYSNATGCNTQQEVEEACWVGISNLNFESEFSICPNPATDKLIIANNNGLKIEIVSIYNQLGQKVFYRNEPIEEIDISILGQGIYIIELTTSELKIRQKLIIEE